MTNFNAFLSASCRITPHVQWGFSLVGLSIQVEQPWAQPASSGVQQGLPPVPFCGGAVPVLTGSRKQPAFLSRIPLPWQTGWRAHRGVWKTSLQDCTCAEDCTMLLCSHQSCHPKQPCHPEQLRLILLAAAHASLGTRVRTHTRSHARTQLAFSNMPDVAFLMLAQEIPVAAWSASFLIRGAAGQAPAPARGGWRGQTHRSWPLRLLSSPIICHFGPLLLSYLGCIFFVIAKQWQKPG